MLLAAHGPARVASRAGGCRRLRFALFQRNSVLVVERRLGRMFLFVGNPLEEVSRFRLVFKQQPCIAFLQLERVEERPVLIVLEVNVQLLIPNNAPVSSHVNQFQEKRVAHKVVDQSNSSAKPSKRPFIGIRVCNIQSGDRGINNLVRRLRDRPLDLLFVLVFEKAHVFLSFTHSATCD